MEGDFFLIDRNEVVRRFCFVDIVVSFLCWELWYLALSYMSSSEVEAM